MYIYIYIYICIYIYIYIYVCVCMCVCCYCSTPHITLIANSYLKIFYLVVFFYPLTISYLKFDQNSVSYFLYLATTTLPHLHLSQILFLKNTSSNQGLYCKYCFELAFLRSKIRKSKTWGKVLVAKIKTVTQNFGQNLCFLYFKRYFLVIILEFL